MTITLAINVGDALVLASDSATTQMMVHPAGVVDTINVWNSANKMFNLHRGLPIGAMTWGTANIDGRSIATLSKDLRCRLMGEDSAHLDWKLDPKNFEIRNVASSVRRFFVDDHPDPKPAGLGFLIGGYSSGGALAEWYLVETDSSGVCRGPTEVLPFGEAGYAAYGQPEAIDRIVMGVSGGLGQALANLGVPPADIPPAVERIRDQVHAPMIFPGMPVGELIDLADFLVDATIKFVRFSPGHAVVGGPIEIAVLTKHEGFKWVKRKHHFDARLNP